MRALVLCLLLSAVLAGCQRPVDPGVTRLEFWTIALSPTFDDYIHGLIAEFERLHPGVKLTWVDLPQQATLQKLMASIAGGVPPDVVNLDTDFALVMAENQALVTMSEAVPHEVQNRYFPGLWSATEYQGEVYAVPWYVTTRVIMYNRAIFEAAGLDPDDPPDTWDELARTARAVHERTDFTGYMPSIRITNDWGMWGVPSVDRETMTATFDSPEGVARLQWYVDLFEEGVVPRETLTEGYRGALDRYKAGTLAILEAGPQFLLKIKSDAPDVYAATGVAPLPRTPTNTVPAATMYLAVPRSSKHRELAVELALFITSPENQLAFDKIVPILPSTMATAEDDYFQTGKGEPLQDQAVRISIEQLPRARDFSLGLPRQSELNRALTRAVEAALYGRIPADVALRQAAEEWNEILGGTR